MEVCSIKGLYFKPVTTTHQVYFCQLHVELFDRMFNFDDFQLFKSACFGLQVYQCCQLQKFQVAWQHPFFSVCLILVHSEDFMNYFQFSIRALAYHDYLHLFLVLIQTEFAILDVVDLSWSHLGTVILRRAKLELH